MCTCCLGLLRLRICNIISNVLNLIKRDQWGKCIITICEHVITTIFSVNSCIFILRSTERLSIESWINVFIHIHNKLKLKIKYFPNFVFICSFLSIASFCCLKIHICDSEHSNPDRIHSIIVKYYACIWCGKLFWKTISISIWLIHKYENVIHHENPLINNEINKPRMRFKWNAYTV